MARRAGCLLAALLQQSVCPRTSKVMCIAFLECSASHGQACRRETQGGTGKVLHASST